MKSALFCWLIVILLAAPRLAAAGNARLETAKMSAWAWIDGHRAAACALSDRLWRLAEPPLQERESAALLADFLEKEGFVVERGVAGLPTAFTARFGRGKPVIGILAEYDALPGLSQEVATQQRPLQPGAAGHGCGHNLFGAGSAAAAAAVKRAMVEGNLPGTLILFGCPAEETIVGKTFMARDGVFSGLDAAVVWHPSDTSEVNTRSNLALNNFKVTFSGRTAHAAGSPWDGRSALDAVELMNIGANYLREHMPPTARIHYVITDGGREPNIVPDTARVWYYVRGADRAMVDELYRRLQEIAKGAALMTGTQYRVELVTAAHQLLVNMTAARAMQRNLQRVGPPVFDAADVAFAKALQAALGREQKGLSTVIAPLDESAKPPMGGSSDVAEVSRIAPTVQVSTACEPLDMPGHNWVTVACSGHELGRKGMVTAAKVMAATALDFLLDPALVRAMQEEFQRATAGRPFQSALPPDLRPETPGGH